MSALRFNHILVCEGRTMVSPEFSVRLSGLDPHIHSQHGNTALQQHALRLQYCGSLDHDYPGKDNTTCRNNHTDNQCDERYRTLSKLNVKHECQRKIIHAGFHGISEKARHSPFVNVTSLQVRWRSDPITLQQRQCTASLARGR